MKFCPQCGKPLRDTPMDGRERKVCSDPACPYVYWNNPTPVVAAVVEWNGAVVLVRSKGWPPRFFGIVAGFQEAGETPEEGILREVREELGLEGRIVDFLGHYAFAEKNQTIAAFHVRAEGPLVPGDEIAEVKALPPEKVKPWDAGTGPAVKEFLKRRMGGMAMERVVPSGEQLVLAVYVQDLEKSCRFFVDFGFVVSRRDGPFVELRWEDALLFLVERPEAKPPETPVGNIRVMVSDVEAIYEKARQSGYPIVTPLADRYYGLKDFVVAGPDGIHLRFATFKSQKHAKDAASPTPSAPNDPMTQ
uniref:NUDIX domain-containing protein n=1 Tax=Desulfacinum infernum TaxID=35837 RepID=A0A831ZYD0_9BACT